jgi:hypothetical protein
MKTFKIEVQELSSRVVEVKAESTENAVNIIREKYRNEEIVLDYSDFNDVSFLIFDKKTKL